MESYSKEIHALAKQVKCLICDVDGVLTDGRLYLDNQGNDLKAFHVQDGMGIKLLLNAGIDVAIITTSQAPIIEHRMKQLGVTHFFTGQVDKRSAYKQLKQKLRLNDEDFAYVGDDLPDIPIIQQVGFPIAVSNAVAQVKEFTRWQTVQPGGNGGVREICDFILLAQNKLEKALQRYLNA